MFKLTSRHGGRGSRKHALVAALICGWLVVTGAAMAGTIGIRGNTLVVGAEASDGDVIVLGAMAGTDLLLEINGAVFDIVTPGCSVDAFGFRCPLAGFTTLEIIGGGGDDVLDFTGVSIAAILVGGAGDDILIAGTGAGALYGGLGLDLLLDFTGSSLLFGGPGDDTVPFGSDLGDDSPDFEPIPRAPVSMPTPGSTLLLLAGLGALAMAQRTRSPGGGASRRNPG